MTGCAGIQDGDGVADGSFTLLAPLDEDGDGIPEPPGDNYGILRGDFGRSFVKKQPVLDVFMANLPATLELGIAAILTSLVIGIPVGVLSAVTRGRAYSITSRASWRSSFDAIPNFWLGYILLFVFASLLNFVPLGGRCVPNLYGVCPPLTFERLSYLVLPTFVFAAGLIALFSRYIRTSTLGSAKPGLHPHGARQRAIAAGVVNFRHAMRNAMMPVATLLGPIITNVWAGAIVIETVFRLARPRAHRFHLRHSARLSGCNGHRHLRLAGHDPRLSALRFSLRPYRPPHSAGVGARDAR